MTLTQQHRDDPRSEKTGVHLDLVSTGKLADPAMDAITVEALGGLF